MMMSRSVDVIELDEMKITPSFTYVRGHKLGHFQIMSRGLDIDGIILDDISDDGLPVTVCNGLHVRVPILHELENRRHPALGRHVIIPVNAMLVLMHAC